MKEELKPVLEHIKSLHGEDKKEILQKIKDNYSGLSPDYLLAEALSAIQNGTCRYVPTEKVTKKEFHFYLIQVVGGDEPRKEFYQHLEDPDTIKRLISITKENYGDIEEKINLSPEDLVQEAIFRFYTGKRKKFPNLKISEKNYLYFMANKPKQVKDRLQGYSIISKIVSDKLASLKRKGEINDPTVDELISSEPDDPKIETFNRAIDKRLNNNLEFVKKSLFWKDAKVILYAANKYNEPEFLEFFDHVKTIHNYVSNSFPNQQPFLTDVFNSYFLFFMTQEEIANNMGCSTTKVNNTVEQLRAIIDQINSRY